MRFLYGEWNGEEFQTQEHLDFFNHLMEFVLQYGDEALENLDQIELDDEQREALEKLIQDGLLEKVGAKWKLTPRAINAMQRKALMEVFSRLRKGHKDGHEIKLNTPHGGSDIANCQTKAIHDGDDYVVNGQKVMVGHHLPPDYLWTLVCTTPGGKRHENLAWLHIPANLPGITIQHMHMMMGIKNSVFFDNVRVPAKYLIGGENNGWKVASTHMELEHGGDGRIAADPLIERVVEYCRNTHIDGKPIMEDPRVRDLIAEMTIELNTLRRFNQLIYWRRFAKKPHPYGGPQQRYYQRMLRLRNGERLQAIMGADALEQNLSVNEVVDFEYAVRTGPGQLHGGGTLDTDRLIFARRLGLGRPTTEKAPETD